VNPSDTTAGRLEIHKLLSEELRHTATVVWQFAVAIVTLQGGAVALSAQSGFQGLLGNCVIATAFFLSACFSLMLLRQAYERRGFRDRIHAVEAELLKSYPEFAIQIPRKHQWFTSVTLAWILVVESLLVFSLFLALSALYLCSAYCCRHA